jgi:hypothetical protein
MKKKYSWTVGIVILIIILALFGIFLYFEYVVPTTNSNINFKCGYFVFSEKIASDLNSAIKILEESRLVNITTERTTQEVFDKNNEKVSKTIYIITDYRNGSIVSSGFDALDSEGNLYNLAYCK